MRALNRSETTDFLSKLTNDGSFLLASMHELDSYKLTNIFAGKLQVIAWINADAFKIEAVGTQFNNRLGGLNCLNCA